nr:autotransporter outer membrane beta-barrel domain-containing protein [Bartonella washoeensis]
MVEYTITEENGDPITFDSYDDKVNITTDTSTVTPLTSPVMAEGVGGVEAGSTLPVLSPTVSSESEQKQSLSVDSVVVASEDSRSSETVVSTASNNSAPVDSLPSAVTSIDSTESTVDSKGSTSVNPVVLEIPRISTVADVRRVSEGDTLASCNSIGGDGLLRSQVPYLCNDGQTHVAKDLKLKASDNTQHSLHVEKEGTVIKLEGATISGADSSDSQNSADLTKLAAVSAVLAEGGAEVILDKKSAVQSSQIGLEAQRGGKVKMIGGTVDVHYVGALAGSGSSVNLSNTTINVTGDLAVAGLVSNAGKITMESGLITLANGVAVRSESGGNVKLDNVNITAKKEKNKPNSAEQFGRAAFLLSDSSSVDFTRGTIATDANALWFKGNADVVETSPSRRRRSSDVRSSMNHANIEFSTIRVEGDMSYGIYFDGTERKGLDQQNQNKHLEKPVSESSVRRSGEEGSVKRVSMVKRNALTLQRKTPVSMNGAVALKGTVFEVPESVAIYGNNSAGRVSLENKSTLLGDLLLRAENNSDISIVVDNSVIAGGARIDKGSYAKLDLTNGSEWRLKRGARESGRAQDSDCIDSCVSSVSLVNSRIEFLPSESEQLSYQTLRIGQGTGTVYKAQGNALINLNARLNPNDPSDIQVTDRLVIHGNVEGKTMVHVQGVSGNIGEVKNNTQNAHSVSVIQVYGKAAKDSFQLSGDYVALENSPYKYTLRSYAPEVTSKQEHVQQKFVKEGGEFWNFRLENQYVKSAVPTVGFVLPERAVRSVVPQVPTYLLLPNSLFHAGLMDISNQNKQLEVIRIASSGMVEVHENPALFLHGYGSNYRYASDLSALEYGYGGDLGYNAVEAGVLLQTIESMYGTMSFGVMGTYGKLSLQPVDVELSQESTFDKWAATAYGSVQHDAGFYVDGLFSYGLLKGDVLTLARDKTAALKSKSLSVSLTGGQSFAMGYEGLTADPQVQVVYQNLRFDQARDIDNFDIEMGKLDKWIVRVGGRLAKTRTGLEGVSAVSFYGKLYLTHDFGKRQTVHFKDAFQLGAFGSSLEGGLGFNVQLSPKFVLHGDLSYQHKLTKAGFSGTSFSGGLRYQF